jgi:hypothetical protein
MGQPKFSVTSGGSTVYLYGVGFDLLNFQQNVTSAIFDTNDFDTNDTLANPNFYVSGFNVFAQSFDPRTMLNTFLSGNDINNGVIPPFLTGVNRRIHAAFCSFSFWFSFWAGVIPPSPMLGRSLL